MTTRRTKPLGAYIGKEDDFQASAITLVRAIAQSKGINPKAIMHVPNGGHRHIGTARKMHGMGVVRGYPDIMCHVRLGLFTGLALELKVWPNKPTDDQLEIHELLRDAGWCVWVCYGLGEVEYIAEKYF